MRYLPLTEADRQSMLAKIGAGSVDDLFCDVSEAARFEGTFDLPDHQSEMAVERRIGAMAAKNLPAATAASFLGAGAYRHHVPASVDHLIQRGEFLTAYTPYQPEISQGTLQSLFEFQTQVAAITGMDVANASMYDGSTACAEAVLMARRITRRGKAILSGGLHPHYREVTATYTLFLDVDVVLASADAEDKEDIAAMVDRDTSCVVVQTPSFFGHLRDFSDLAARCHAAGALLIVVFTEVVSLGLLKSPGEMGADIVVGEGQSLGNAMSFGGPYVGLFTTRQKYLRQMPGRLCGQTTDADGRRGWVLTLSTREQHIRREKATSNICTNAGLCALAFGVHLALLGEVGFAKLAALNHAAACQLADRLDRLRGVEVLNASFFNEFTVRLPRSADAVVSALAKKQVLGGVPVSRLYPDRPAFDNLMLVTATECNDETSFETLETALREVL